MDNATKQQNSSNAREGNGLPAMLTRLRENAGMTQEEASKLFEVNRSTYAYYETGKSHPKYPLLCKMAHAYEVSTDYLLGMKSTASNTADTLHDAGVAYDANNEQPSSYLKGQINDGIAELSNVAYGTVSFANYGQRGSEWHPQLYQLLGRVEQRGVGDPVPSVRDRQRESEESP